MNPEELFFLLADQTRLRCLYLLHREKSLCVCEFPPILDCSQPKISRHLALLRRAGLITDERKGQWVHYSINEHNESWVGKLLNVMFEELKSKEPFITDLEKKKKSTSGLC